MTYIWEMKFTVLPFMQKVLYNIHIYDFADLNFTKNHMKKIII